MLSIYDPYDDVPGYLLKARVALNHLASELGREYGFENDAALQLALAHALDVCRMLHIPIRAHFMRVFLYGNTGLETDWLLSDLGAYLLLMNAGHRNYYIARAQLYPFFRSK